MRAGTRGFIGLLDDGEAVVKLDSGIASASTLAPLSIGVRCIDTASQADYCRWLMKLAPKVYFSLLLSAGLIGPAAAADDTSGPKDSQTIIARGIIRVAITKFDLPAFHWRDAGGELAGPEVELARVIGRLLRVGVVFVDDCPTYEAVIDAVAGGRADIGLSKLSQTPYRVLRVRFSNPYLTLRQSFLFDRAYVGQKAVGRHPEDELRKFSGTLGVVAKSEYVDFARRNFADARIAEHQSWDDALEALVNSRLDAIYGDEFEVRRALKKNPALNVRFGTAAFTDVNSFLSVAICATCIRLQEFVNYQIAENRVPFSIGRMLAAEEAK